MIRSRRLRNLALLLALFGVLLRGAIPPGFMPAFGSDAYRGAWLALCSGGALAPPTHDDGGHALQMQQECPYAAAATPTLPSTAPFAPAELRTSFVALYSDAAAPPRQLPDLPRARGPPTLG